MQIGYLQFKWAAQNLNLLPVLLLRPLQSREEHQNFPLPSHSDIPTTSAATHKPTMALESHDNSAQNSLFRITISPRKANPKCWSPALESHPLFLISPYRCYQTNWNPVWTPNLLSDRASHPHPLLVTN